MSGGSNSTVNSIARSTVGGLPIVGDVMKGDAAQDLATAQGNAATSQLDQQERDRAEAMRIAQPSDQQMAELTRAISTNKTDITRKQALLDSADPAFIESGKQALQILKGGDNATTAAALQPIQEDRANQRQQLAARLQQQLGPGWESSSTGQQALASFDAATASTLNNARMSTLAQLMGYAGQSEQFGNLQNNIMNSHQNVATEGNMKAMQINAITGTPITMAGAPFVKDIASNTYAIGQMAGASNTLGNLYGFAQSGGQVNPFTGQKVPQASPAAAAGGSGGGAGPTPGAVPFSEGGVVPGVMEALIHAPPPEAASEQKQSGGGVDAAGFLSLAKLFAASRGGRVPGQAPIVGDNRRNDVVPAMLSPGEIVIPRSVVMRGPKAIAAFAAKLQKRA